MHEAKLAKMEAEMKMVFQQKVQEKEAKLKQSEEELYARHREMKEALEKQRLDLEDKKRRIENGRPLTPEGKTSVSRPFYLLNRSLTMCSRLAKRTALHWVARDCLLCLVSSMDTSYTSAVDVVDLLRVLPLPSAVSPAVAHASSSLSYIFATMTRLMFVARPNHLVAPYSDTRL